MMISTNRLKTELTFNPVPTAEPPSSEILWAIPYGSAIYRQVNWWTGFLLSRYMDVEKVRSGESFLVGTEKFVPNKWTLVYSLSNGPAQAMQQLNRIWSSLGSPKLQIYAENFDDLPIMNAEFSPASKPKMITFHRTLHIDG